MRKPISLTFRLTFFLLEHRVHLLVGRHRIARPFVVFTLYRAEHTVENELLVLKYFSILLFGFCGPVRLIRFGFSEYFINAVK
jgi:hypothetical protein